MQMGSDLKVTATKYVSDAHGKHEAPKVTNVGGLSAKGIGRRNLSSPSLPKFLRDFCYNLFRPLINVRVPAQKTHVALRALPIAKVILGMLLTALISFGSSWIAFRTSPYKADFTSRLTNTVPISASPHTSAIVLRSLADSSNEQYVEDTLVRAFDVPPSLTRKIPTSQRYILLTKLQKAKQRATTSALRLFVLHVVGSVASGRLSAIASSLAYAQNTERFLVILWDLGRGGEAFGSAPITRLVDIEKYNIMFTYVESLQLNPNLTNWSEFKINYYTKSGTGGYPLDSVAALSSRHIFYRADQELEGRYSSLSQGISFMPKVVRPEPPMERAWYNFVKEWTFPHLDDSEATDLLNRVYGVPLVFLDGIASDQKRKLLRALDRSSSKRAFFIHAQYGLGNRLRALGSAMAVAQVTGRVLVLIWEPDVHLNCNFGDLFINDFVVIEKLNMNWPPGDTRTRDHAMRTVDFYNFMRFNGKHIHNPQKELVNPRSGRHVYVKTAYVVRSSFTPRIISTHSGYWKIMREQLVPQAEIMSIVHDPAFINIRGMVGVHIRSRTIENDIKGVSEEFYGSGSRTTDHWRRLTGLKTFEAKIIRLSLKYKFFVAADSREAIHVLERKFGSHRIFSIPRDKDCVTRDVECAKLALADILLLSKVPTLLGSHWSSFTEGAVRMSGRVKVLLAGVHFGRKK